MKQSHGDQAKDLTRTSERLKQSEERYHKMIEEVEDYAIILLDEDGHIQNWNKGAEKIKGYEETEILGQHFRIFYMPVDQAEQLPTRLLERAARDGKSVHEGWRVRKNGTRFWGSVTLTALHEGDEVIGYCKVTRDLTERKLAEDQLRNFTTELQLSNQALRTSEERYHKMIAEVQDYAIISLDVDGHIQNWNAGAAQIKGYTSAEIVGRHFQIFYTDTDRIKGLPQQLLAEAASNGRAIHEGWRVKKDGSRFWGSIVITALHGDDGALIGYSKVTRDLTEKKQTEDKLKEYVHDLQRQNEELDRFAYAASHDLQEPLRKVQTFADLIEQSPANTEVVNLYIRKISASAERMASLIKSVLDFSKVSRLRTEKIPTDLNDIFTGVLSDLELVIEEKQAVIRYDTLPVIEAVPPQVTQLFGNLFSNALKFSYGQPVITLSATIVSSSTVSRWPDHLVNGDYHQLTLTDLGIGFEPKYAEQIFSLFQRLHGKEEFAGTGIGLALCKRIMDNHDGFIYAEGRPGEGATFYLYFPCVRG